MRVPTDDTWRQIRAEANNANVTHARVDDPIRALTIIAEEFGEVAKEILTATRQSIPIRMREKAWEQAQREAVQLASAAASLAELIAEIRAQ